MDMRRMAILVGCLSAACGLVTADAAGAFSGRELFITDHGVTMPVNEEIHGRMLVVPRAWLGQCEQWERGLLDSNGKASDRIGFGTVYERSCTSGDELGGVLQEAKLTAKGAFTAKASGKLVFTAGPEPCVYETSKAAGSIQLPSGPARSVLLATAKLNRSASASCANKSLTLEITYELFDEGDEPLGEEL